MSIDVTPAAIADTGGFPSAAPGSARTAELMR